MKLGSYTVCDDCGSPKAKKTTFLGKEHLCATCEKRVAKISHVWSTPAIAKQAESMLRQRPRIRKKR